MPPKRPATPRPGTGTAAPARKVAGNVSEPGTPKGPDPTGPTPSLTVRDGRRGYATGSQPVWTICPLVTRRDT
ncbi:hypothetical protein GCM10010519_52600 [Streptomyces lactacystinicus]